MHRLSAFRLYLIMCGGNAVLRSSIYLVLSVYYVLTVRMNPFELVLAGTALEASYFLFQLPTGLAADAFSRRASIIAGWAICGACFAVEGVVPRVGVILAAQAVLGLGEACIDGAEAAWLADELGPDRLGRAMVRGSRIAQVAGITGIGVAAVLGSIHLNLPVFVGGVGMLGMSGFFALAMPERGFTARRPAGSTPGRSVSATLRGSVRHVRGSSILLTLMTIELFAGAGSEGFDRLWEAHIVRDVGLPRLGGGSPVAWFALLAVAGSIVSYALSRYLEPRIDGIASDTRRMKRGLAVLNLLYVAATVAFACSGSFIAASIFLLLRSAILTPSSLVRDLWLNRSITDSSVRATVLSLGGQSNALGQWIGGPAIGVVGTVASLRAAIAAAGAITSPIAWLYARLDTGTEPTAVAPAPAAAEA